MWWNRIPESFTWAVYILCTSPSEFSVSPGGFKFLMLTSRAHKFQLMCEFCVHISWFALIHTRGVVTANERSIMSVSEYIYTSMYAHIHLNFFLLALTMRRGSTCHVQIILMYSITLAEAISRVSSFTKYTLLWLLYELIHEADHAAKIVWEPIMCQSLLKVPGWQGWTRQGNVPAHKNSYSSVLMQSVKE